MRLAPIQYLSCYAMVQAGDCRSCRSKITKFTEPINCSQKPEWTSTHLRNGYLPERDIRTGIGSVTVKLPKIRDKSGQGIKFNQALLPSYLRKAKSVEEVLPGLYLKGISTCDFQEALQALLGINAAGLPPSTIGRLKSVWEEEHEVWSRRSLKSKQFVYIWTDGVYFNIRDGVMIESGV